MFSCMSHQKYPVVDAGGPQQAPWIGGWVGGSSSSTLSPAIAGRVHFLPGGIITVGHYRVGLFWFVWAFRLGNSFEGLIRRLTVIV